LIIEVERPQQGVRSIVFSPFGGDAEEFLEGIMSKISTDINSINKRSSRSRREKFKSTVANCKKMVQDAEERIVLDKQKDDITRAAIQAVEESGIIFVDEIDKLAQPKDFSNYRKGEGVQKELLALFEGTTVRTKHGTVRTDHILFIGSGAFHISKPSDLMPELQGRLPIRVQLDALTQSDYEKILGETQFNILEQQTALMKTEDVDITFTKDAITEIARLTMLLNTNRENIGARRLHTLVARVISDLSFNAPKNKGAVTIDANYVQSKVVDLLKLVDLRKYIL